MEPLSLMVNLSFYGNDNRNRAELKRVRRAKRSEAASRDPRAGVVRRAALRLKALGA